MKVERHVKRGEEDSQTMDISQGPVNQIVDP